MFPRWIPSALRVVKEEDRWYHMKTESRKCKISAKFATQMRAVITEQIC